MDFAAEPNARFPGYRFPAVIIGEVVWLRFRFNLSLRDIPALMATRGVVLSRSRDTHAARKFLRKLLKSEEYVYRVLITDKLRSYGAAKRQVMASVEHRSHKGLNNRAENSHQRTRGREYAMRRFKAAGHPKTACAKFQRRFEADATAPRSVQTSCRKTDVLGRAMLLQRWLYFWD